MPQDTAVLRLRPHHLCCLRYGAFKPHRRGEAYGDYVCGLIRSMESSDTLFQVHEGLDIICQVCPERVGDYCNAPGGDSRATRWDAKLLADLGVAFGTTMTAAEWAGLIASKAPFRVCPNCEFRSKCRQGKAASGL